MLKKGGPPDEEEGEQTLTWAAAPGDVAEEGLFQREPTCDQPVGINNTRDPRFQGTQIR